MMPDSYPTARYFPSGEREIHLIELLSWVKIVFINVSDEVKVIFQGDMKLLIAGAGVC